MLDILPIDLLKYLLKFCSFRDIVSVCKSSKHFNEHLSKFLKDEELRWLSCAPFIGTTSLRLHGLKEELDVNVPSATLQMIFPPSIRGHNTIALCSCLQRSDVVVACLLSLKIRLEQTVSALVVVSGITHFGLAEEIVEKLKQKSKNPTFQTREVLGFDSSDDTKVKQNWHALF